MDNYIYVLVLPPIILLSAINAKIVVGDICDFVKNGCEDKFL